MPVQWDLANQGQYDYLQSLQGLGNAALQQQSLRKSQYDFNQQQRQDQSRPALFAQAQGGDYKGAGNAALAGGDLDAYKVISGLDDQQRQQVKAHAQLIGGFAANLASIPDGPGRAAALRAAAPQLLQQGFTPEELQNADLSDNGLRGYIAAASATDGALAAWEKSQQPLTVTDGTKVFGATPMGGGQRPLIADNPKDPPKPIWDSDRAGWVTLPTAENPSGTFTPLGGVPSGGVAPQGGGASGNPYDVVLGNGAYGKPPAPISSMAIGDVYDFGRNVLIPNSKAAGVGKDSRGLLGSSAVGAYQITGETLRRFAPQVLGPDWQNQQFTPQVQDRLAEAIYNDAVSKGTPLNKVWASLSPGDAAALQGRPWSQVRDTIVRGESGGAPSGGNGSALPPKMKTAPSGYEYSADGKSLQPINGGPADPNAPSAANNKQNRGAMVTLRKEFDNLPEVKTFKTARTQFETLKGTALKQNPTPQDDIATVFTFMKTLDPNSTVREGEYATAKNAAGVPDQVKNWWNKLQTGGFLTQQQRVGMVNAAGQSYKAIRDQYNTAAERYRGYARDQDLAPDSVARTYTVIKPNKSAPAPKAGWKITERQ